MDFRFRLVSHGFVLSFQTKPVEREFLFSFYTGAKQQHPDFYSTYTFESYLGYLTSADLVSTERGQYSITAIGRGFLEFLAESCNSDRDY